MTIETILTTILGDIAAAGGIVAVLCLLGKKLLALIYESLREKISADIENEKTEFANVLERKLKYLESELAKALHASETQYDIEVKAYEEISQKLYACSYAVKELYEIPLMENEKVQAERAKELRTNAINAYKAFEAAYEEKAPFIQKEIVEAINVYISYLQKLTIICGRYIYGVRQGMCEDDLHQATELYDRLNSQKLLIQNYIRERLSTHGEVEENLWKQ